MLVVRTYLAASPIHGIGLFAGEHVAKGAIVWRPSTGDQIFAPGFTKYAHEVFAEFLARYAFKRSDGSLLLPGDDARFMNHDNPANLTCGPLGEDLASRDIAVGEELTCCYWEFDCEWRAKLNRSGIPPAW